MLLWRTSLSAQQFRLTTLVVYCTMELTKVTFAIPQQLVLAVLNMVTAGLLPITVVLDVNLPMGLARLGMVLQPQMSRVALTLTFVGLLMLDRLVLRVSAAPNLDIVETPPTTVTVAVNQLTGFVMVVLVLVVMVSVVL